MLNWTFDNGVLAHAGRPLFAGGGAELSLEADAAGNGVFLTAKPKESPFWAYAALGRPAAAERFAATYVLAHSPFWMRPAAGGDLAALPPQTTWLLIRHEDGAYTMVVPLPSATECNFLCWRDGALHFYSETGDMDQTVAGGLCAYVAHGADPLLLAEKGAESVAGRLPNAKLRRSKKLPPFVDKFGWCTWNAFYGAVDHDKVRSGLDALKAAGIPPRLVVLDDGWQQTEPLPTGGHALAGFGANAKFPGGLKETVAMAKGEFGVEAFLVWHAVCGYWKGVHPEKLPKYKSRKVAPQFGRFNNAQAVFDWQVGFYSHLPSRKFADFYNDYHAALAAEGVDGVKVDNQASLTYLAAGSGGRAKLFKTMREALERSVGRHFGGALITCMAHAPEVWYNARTTNLARGSDDFYPDDAASHGWHVYVNAMNGVWFGNFTWLDWDMFQSTNPFGPYHAAARAVSGGPVYIADKPGEHDAALVRKLLFRDGTPARCEAPGRLTADCLLVDPFADHAALKVFGTTPHGAVVGLFDVETASDGAIQATVSPEDVPGSKAARYAVWLHEARLCQVVNRQDRLRVNLGARKYDVATIAPVRFGGVAVFGLVELFNASAAVMDLRRAPGDDGVCVKLRNGGRFAAWTQAKPAQVRVDGAPVAFTWTDGLLEASVESDAACEVLIGF